MPSSDNLFVLIDANARTGVRIGDEDCKVTGAYGRNTRVSDSNGTSLLRFTDDNKLAFVNTFFSVPKGCTFRSFIDTRLADRKRVDYIITRQSHRKLVRNVTVHLQPRTESDSPADSLVTQNSEPPQGARILTNQQSRLTPTDATADTTCSQSTHADRTRCQSAKKRPFSPTHFYGPQKIMPGQTRQSCLFRLFRMRHCTPNLRELGRRGKKIGRRCTAPWPAALLFARCGRHA